MNEVQLPSDNVSSETTGRSCTIAQLILIALVGTLFSIGLQGFDFGVDNNYFHLPIVLSLDKDPNFATDPYVQSLKYYVSGFWQIVKMFTTEENVRSVFLTLHVLSRWLFLIGLLLCARLLGVRSVVASLLFVLLVCLSRIMTGASVAGSHDLLHSVFTHTHVANALTLFVLYCLATNRIGWAMALNGPVFLINSFVAIWNLAPIGIWTLWLLVSHQLDTRQWLRQIFWGSVAFLALSAPVALWISQAQQGGGTLEEGVRYADFLRYYYPSHFLFTEIPLQRKLIFSVLVVSSLVAFRNLGKIGQPWFAMVVGYSIVYLTGIAAPWVTDSQSILNLHFLRVSGFIHFLAFLGTAALAIRCLSDSNPTRRFLVGPMLLFGSARSVAILPTLILEWISRRTNLLNRSKIASVLERRLIQILVCLAIGGTAFISIGQERSMKTFKYASADWMDLAQWAKTQTPVGSTFLLPLRQANGVTWNDKYVPWWYLEEPAFEAFTHRRPWVTFKEGAAVMWMPSFYKDWHRKVEEVDALDTLAEEVRYAQAHDIDYILTETQNPEALPPGVTIDYENTEMRVLRVHR